MHTSLSFLKDVGKFERDLVELECKRTIQRLTPYADYPEVAKVIDYMNTYRDPIPETHMVFGFIDGIEKKKQGKLEVQKIVRNRMAKKGIDVPLSDLEKEAAEKANKKRQKQTKEQLDEETRQINEESKKCIEIVKKFDGMMLNLEKECDKTFDFFNKNAHSMELVVKHYRLTGVRNLLTGLKNNLRALKVR